MRTDSEILEMPVRGNEIFETLPMDILEILPAIR